MDEHNPYRINTLNVYASVFIRPIHQTQRIYEKQQQDISDKIETESIKASTTVIPITYIQYTSKGKTVEKHPEQRTIDLLI